MSNLNKKLLINLPDEVDSASFETQYKKILDFIEPVKITLSKELEKNLIGKSAEIEFDSPNWQYKQAYINGQIQALKLILDILTVKDDDQSNN